VTADSSITRSPTFVHPLVTPGRYHGAAAPLSMRVREVVP
jgi:hypothetical protein